MLGLALIALLALGAAAAVASAASWKVGGKYLEAGKTEAFTGTNTTQGLFDLEKYGTSILNPIGGCTLTGNIVGGSAGMKDVILKCKEVGTTESQLCSINTLGQPVGSVITEKLIGTASGEQITFSRSGSAPWAYIEPGGKYCWLPGTGYVTGTATANTSMNNKEQLQYTLGFFGGSLYFPGLSNPARLRGSFNLTLNSGKTFGVFK